MAAEVTRSADGRTHSAEVRIESGGEGCPMDLAARLSLVPIASFDKLTKSLPAGCAVLRIDLPAGASLAAHRFEAAAEGELQSCAPNGSCPVEAAYFEGAPIVRRSADGSAVLAIFVSSTSAARRGVLTVEVR